jgi:hypothetical protein
MVQPELKYEPVIFNPYCWAARLMVSPAVAAFRVRSA